MCRATFAQDSTHVQAFARLVAGRRGCEDQRPGRGALDRSYHGSMTDLVTAVPGKKRIVGPGWSLRAERVDVLDGNRWRALIGIRRGLKLLVAKADETELFQVEAWTAEPGQSDGVAVVEAGDGRWQLARVPLCECGDRGCGNAGVQLYKSLPGGELAALVDLLRELSWTGVVPTHSDVLRGNDLAAIDGPGDHQRPGGASYAYSPLTGKTWPPTRR